jgi:hypothetical protein
MNVKIKHKNSGRKVKVKFDSTDFWNLDSTLAEVIHPALKELKKLKNGTPSIDKADIPEELWTEEQKSGVNEWDFSNEGWNWVLDEMIWAFKRVKKFDYIFDDEENDRLHNGLRLFGKYYLALWT